MGLSSAGIGSNLDVNGIVTQLMGLEQKPLTSLVNKESAFQAKLSAVGSLKGAMSSFQTAVKALSDANRFQAVRANSSDSTAVSVGAGSNAVPGSYAVEITRLAQAQKLAAAGVAASNTAIGSGTITFDFGTIAGGSFDSASGKYTGAGFTTNGAGVKTVTVASGNNSLSGIRDAINAAKIGVTASIINDGGDSPFRLVLSQESTGKTGSMKISVDGDAALGSLLSHDPGGLPAVQRLTETVTAQNAELKVDGVSISKPGNVVTDAIEGVTLTLAKTNSGTPTTVSVSRDTSSVTGAVGQFVFAFNQINQTLTGLSSYNAASKQSAILNGDAAVRTIQTQLRGVLTAPVAGGASAYTLLSQVGVTMQKDGTLAVDNTKLSAAIETNYAAVAGLFAATGKSSDSLVTYSGSGARTVPGSYVVSLSQIPRQASTSGSLAIAATGEPGFDAKIIAGVNDTLEVVLDGVTATVTLAAGNYSHASLAGEVQSKINGTAAFTAEGSKVTVTQNAGVVTITSNRYGSASAMSIAGGNGKTDLLGGAPAVTTGLDAAGTINGVAGTGVGQVLSGASNGSTEGLRLTIGGGDTGARGTVSYSKGYAYQFDKLLDTLLGDEGPLKARTDGLTASLKSLSVQKERLALRLNNIETRYRAQFTALDLVMSNMTSTSSFLAQQLANLPKIE